MRAAPSRAAPAKPAPSATPRPRWLWLRFAALAFAPLALVTGLAGGLWRLGWGIPGGTMLAMLHGPLMICGLFGTLISLERAVAFGTGWAYAAPLLSAFGTVALLAGAPPAAGAIFYLAAAGILAVASGLIMRAQPAVFTVALLFGALAWGIGDVLWLTGEEIPRVVGWWSAFLLLTIAGERLEMSRLLPPRRGSRILFAVSAGLIVAGAFMGLTNETGALLYGFGLLACALWLLRHDIARRNIRGVGATRYFAVCMLAGYCWLAIAGGLMVLMPPSNAMFAYDMALHAVLIGFVLSMVFGHALIILPAVTRLRVSYSPMLYLPLLVLHGSLAMRIGGGLGEWNLLRQWSGVATALAIVIFAVGLAFGAAQARRQPS